MGTARDGPRIPIGLLLANFIPPRTSSLPATPRRQTTRECQGQPLMITKASFLICAFVLSLAAAAYSQTTIFNIPSADTLERRTVNVEGDFLIKPVRYRNGGYQTY